MEPPPNRDPTNYQHIKFNHGNLCDIPSEYFSYFPPRNTEDPSSQEQYSCDVRKFTKLTSPFNNDIPSLSNAVSKFLPVGSVFRNKSELQREAERVCRSERFVISNVTQQKLKCNRATCPFAIDFVSIFKKEPSIAAVKTNREKGKRKPNQINCYEYPCAISNVNNTHNHPCDRTNFLQSAQASGKHSRSLKRETIWMLIAMMRNNPTLSAASISSVINIASPKCKVWSSDDICNVRAKVKKLITRLKITNDTSHDEFLEQFCDDEYKSFFDDAQTTFFADTSTFESRAILDNLLRSQDDFNQVDKEEHNTTIIDYLELLRNTDESFDYRLLLDNDNYVQGVAYMTGAMRAAFDIFGESISLDAMKKRMNTSCFPYFAVVLIRDDHTIDIGLEALTRTENIQAYQFIIDSLFEMAYERRRDEVFVVTSDDFLSQEIVTRDLKLCNAIYMGDYYHLLQLVWPNNFRPNAWATIKTAVKEMADASSEKIFVSAYETAKKHLTEMNAPASELSYLAQIESRKEEYALYFIRNTSGTFECRGSQRSECQHAFIVFRLGDKYFSSPYRQICDLLHTGMYRQDKYRKALCADYDKLTKLHSNIMTSAENGKNYDPILLAASSRNVGTSLSFAAFIMLKEELERIQSYAITIDPAGTRSIQYISGSNEGKVRTFQTVDTKCPGCATSKANMTVCVHMLCNRISRLPIDDVFDISLFPRRYHFRRSPPLFPRPNVRPGEEDPTQPITSKLRISHDMNTQGSSHHNSLESNDGENHRDFESFETPTAGIINAHGVTKDSNTTNNREKLGYTHLLNVAKRAVEVVNKMPAAKQREFASLLVAVENFGKQGVSISNFGQNMTQLYQNFEERRDPINPTAIGDTTNLSEEAVYKDPLPNSFSFNNSQPRKRPKPSNEIYRQNKVGVQRRSNVPKGMGSTKTSAAKCSFCNGTNHAGFISKCPIRLSYGERVMNTSDFRRRIMKDYPISRRNIEVSFDYDDDHVFRKKKYHFVINSIHPKNDLDVHLNGQGSQPEDIVLDVTLLQRKGVYGVQGLPAFKNRGITADCLLNRLDSLAKDHFVFDNIKKTGVGQDFVTRSNRGTSVLNENDSVPTPALPLIDGTRTMYQIREDYYQTNRPPYEMEAHINFSSELEEENYN